MKTNTNRYRHFFAAFLVGSSLLLPTLASAQDGTSTPTSTTNQNNFCNSLANAESKSDGAVAKRFNDSGIGAANRDKRIDQRAATAAAKLKADRDSADARRAASFSKLEARAKTADQKAAVSAFEASVTQAVQTRRAAVDAANDAFMAGIKAAVSNRQQALDAAAKAYQTSVSSAYATAIASCKAGTPAATVRTTLKASLAQARSTYHTARANVQKVGVNVRELAATRNAAVRAAQTAFKTAIEAAAAKLKAAMAVTQSTSPSPSPAKN